MSHGGDEVTTHHNPRVDFVLSETGATSGSQDMSVDGDAEPVLFWMAPPATGSIVICRILFMLEDDKGFSATKFGNGGALAQGLQIGMFDIATQELAVDYLGGRTIKTNADFGAASYDVSLKTWGTGDDVLLCRWTISSAGTGTELHEGQSTCLGVKVRDNLVGINKMICTLQGHIIHK